MSAQTKSVIVERFSVKSVYEIFLDSQGLKVTKVSGSELEETLIGSDSSPSDSNL